MDKTIIINLSRLDVNEFCERCETLTSDIDLIDGSNVLDAKDYDHISLLVFNHNFCVSINTNDENEILRFNKLMDKYKAV